MTTTFETAKVGDRVWSSTRGWGEITRIENHSNYPITVKYDSSGFGKFTFGGCLLINGAMQGLFWDEIVIEAPVKTAVNLTSDAKQVSELRDRLAIAYMQSCVAGNAYFETFEGVSEEAYKMADVMLEARSK